MSTTEPEGTQLAAQLADAVGGPEVPADPETETVDQRRKLGEATRLGESWVMEDGIRREDGLSLLAVLGDAALPVGAVLDRPTIDAQPSGEARLGDDTGCLTGNPDRSRERPWVSEDFRIRLARAMYESLDRCPRCKVCEHQIGAAAKVMAEAVSAERDRARRAEAAGDRLLTEITAVRALALTNGIPLADLERMHDAAHEGKDSTEGDEGHG